MAAGLSIKEADFSRFSQLFDQIVRQELDESALQGVIVSDGELLPEELSMPTAQQIRTGGPWGQNFPEPIFDGEFKLLQQKLVAGKHLKLIVEPLLKGHPSNMMVDAIAFNVDLRQWPDAAKKTVRLAYRLDINEFRGNQSLQLMVEHLE
jgi:single-stranded-DNA-specific exonuclease